MLRSTAELQAVQQVTQLEPAVLRLEQSLAGLAHALCHNDAQALEVAAATLHKALLAAVADFRRAALKGAVAPELRKRLVVASGQVAAQRQALARAMASLDRAIDVLMPEQVTLPVYDAQGAQGRSGFRSIQA